MRRSHRISRYLVACVLVGFAASSDARLIDPTSPTDPLLDRLTAALDRFSVDTARNLSSQEAAHAQLQRPRLGRLATLPIPLGSGDGRSEVWEEQFRAGFVAGMAALQTKTSNPTNSEFWAEWHATNPEKRVFISFTRADRNAAGLVAQALKSEGYVVFTYLDASEERPWAQPDDVGRFYASAGQHLVIDSSNARGSPGVLVEFQELARLSIAAAERAPRVSLPPVSAHPPAAQSTTGMLFYNKAGCPHCWYQRPIVEQFQKEHPEVPIRWVDASKPPSETDRVLLRGTTGHPVMVFTQGDDRSQIVGETPLAELQAEYQSFMRATKARPKAEPPVKRSGGSYIVCYH